MSKTKRILLIESPQLSSFESELILRIGGYAVETCRELNMALNRYSLYRNSELKFDLIVAIVDFSQRQILEKFYHDGFIERLLLFHRDLSCRKAFCVTGDLTFVCHPGALLAGVNAALATKQVQITETIRGEKG